MKLVTSVLALLLPLPLLSAPATTTAPTDTETYRVGISYDLPYMDVEHSGQPVRVKRIQDTQHRLTDDFSKTSRQCPPFCIQPMQVHDEVKTIGEVELLTFVKQKVNNNEGLLLDARLASWYQIETIPGAISTPFTLFKEPTVSRIVKAFGATEDADGFLSFDQVAELAVFCNGPWCSQSPIAIRGLLNAGYPPEKLAYYRGGMQAWKGFGLTTVVPKKQR